MSGNGRKVTVYVRTRPTAKFAQEFIEYLPDGQTVVLRQKKDCRRGVVNNQLCSWSFHVDGVLHHAPQEEVYNRVARPVVLAALEGYNGTIMCFGQTGAGKTYTMTGATESYKQRGIIPRALKEVFAEIKRRHESTITVRLSFLEIYNETLVDLLQPGHGAMTVVEEPGGGVCVKGLSLHPVHNEEDALNLLFEGEMSRIVGDHALNRNSSRSHCIFSIYTESRSETSSDAKYVSSKVNLVDLAGSERSEGQVLKETVYINKSLSFLEQTILALTDRRREHVPYRQSKLTHALKDSLGGNCNMVLVANIYGEAAQIEETVSTLRFASRMKRVQIDPSVNEHIDPVLHVKKLEKEIQLLKQELYLQDIVANRTGMSYDRLSEIQVAEIRWQVKKYLEGNLADISIGSVRQIQEVFAQFKLAMQEQERKVRAELSVNTTVEEKTEPTAEPGGMKEGIGEVKGQGFGLELAGSNEKHVVHRTKKAKENQAGRVKQAEPALTQKEDPLLTSEGDTEGHKPENNRQEPQGLSSTSLTEQNRPDSPPSKEEAFEDFKLELGLEINCILKENKAVLIECRTKLKMLTDGVNAVKREIDSTTSMLQKSREHRQSRGEFLSEGEPVVEEAELALLLQLRELRTRYRHEYEELCRTRAEVNYCQNLVDQCRIRLLTDFEIWYNESFLLPEKVQVILKSGGSIRPGLVPVKEALALEEDEQNQYPQLHYEQAAGSFSAIAFYNANRKLHRRSSNRVVSQTRSFRKHSRGPGIKLPES
ncbi:kinesin-like protein KIF9 [Denticeps clupeoides]|uniref:kinesin-like protein KIF9 n=1 Tax=Denticeps clupeoides TaxID=299321 RepID=UPI0010A2BA69|nr:kinesin-like protein KIF9 [Denticeps clupeoides]